MRAASIQGKVALVTGSSRGIGASVARSLAREGANVIINARTSRTEAEEVRDHIRLNGGSADVEMADISSPEQCQSLFERLQARNMAPTILINNAGILRDRSFRKMSLEEWSLVLRTNLDGARHCTHYCLPAMYDQGFGRIINMSSFIGQTGGFGQTNYAAAKAGIIGFTKALAVETAAYNITVNAVCPGYVATSMWESIPETVRTNIVATIPMKRVADVEEVSACVRFLVLDGSYITGQTINVNGGLFRAG